jgi:DNA-binding response OmpR family regulator
MQPPASHTVLVVQELDGSLRDVPLPSDRVVLGRDPGCDIVITGRLVSRRHAAIERAGGVFVIEDLGSRNGTTVNGQPISSPHKLHDGDRIELGGVGQITFVDGDATSTRPMPTPTGVWLDPHAMDVWVDGQCLSPRLSPAQFSLLQMLVAYPDHICSRDDIINAVWPGTPDGVSDEAIDALIKRVRARLGEVPNGQAYLQTIRGRGILLRSAPRP